MFKTVKKTIKIAANQHIDSKDLKMTSSVRIAKKDQRKWKISQF